MKKRKERPASKAISRQANLEGKKELASYLKEKNTAWNSPEALCVLEIAVHWGGDALI